MHRTAAPSGTDSSPAAASPTRRLHRLRTVFAAGLLVAGLGSVQHYRSDLHTANEAARIYAAQALVQFGDPSLNPVFDHYFPSWRTRGRPPNVDVSVRQGRYLLDKAPGVTLGAVPVVALLHALGLRLSYAELAWLLTLLLSVLPTVGALLWMGRRLGRSLDPSAGVYLLGLAVASPWTVYAGLLFGHALAAALVGTGVLLSLGPLRIHAVRPWETEGPKAPPRLEPALGGLLLGLAVLTEYTAGWIVVVILGALLADGSRRARLGWVVLGGLGPAAALAAWNWALFGHPAHFSYAYKWNPLLSATHGRGLLGVGLPTWDGLWGLTFSARRGLLHWAPWLGLGLLGAFGAGLDGRLGRAWRLLLGIGPIGGLLLISGFGDWHGGRAVGPRYLLFLVPLWGIGGAWALHRLRHHPARAYLCWALLGLGLSSAFLSLLAATGIPYVDHRVANPLFEVVLPVATHNGLGPTIWDGLLPRPWGARLVLATVVTAALLLLRGMREQSPPGRRATESCPGDGEDAPTRGLRPSTPGEAGEGLPAGVAAASDLQAPGQAEASSVERFHSGAPPVATTPRRWRLALIALSAAVLHLAAASLPITPGERGRKWVERERRMAEEVLNLETASPPHGAKRPPAR